MSNGLGEACSVFLPDVPSVMYIKILTAGLQIILHLNDNNKVHNIHVYCKYFSSGKYTENLCPLS